MSNCVDLHLHTTASDGRFSPAEIVRKAYLLGVNIIAVTDHDTVSGIDPAAEEGGKISGFTFIPGIEISTYYDKGEAHILGYYIDHHSRELLDKLETFKLSRKERAGKMVDKLNKLGMDIEWSRVEEIASGSTVGRPHIAQSLLEKGYISSFKEAFDKYIGYGGPAYVERLKTTPAEAVEMVIKAGGLPVLAHPLFSPKAEELIKGLLPYGLVGIEVYYNGYTEEERNLLLGWSEKYHLLPTGGSDYHGLDENTETMLGQSDVPLEVALRLIERASVTKGTSET